MVSDAPDSRSRPLGVGVIGLGVGEQHVLGFQRATGARVVALCDLDPDKRQMASERYPDCDVSDDADALIDRDDIDIVAIASFDDHHAAQVTRAVRQGKHVFCEKPLCTSEVDLAAIGDALAEHPDVLLSTNTILRMSPRFVDLRNRIGRGELGRLYYLEADYNYGRLHKLAQGWRGEIPDYSVMLGGGIHMIDLVHWLSGQRVIEVFAAGNKLCSDGFNFSTPDMVVAILKLDNGVMAKVSANFGCQYPHFHKLGVYGTDGTFENSLGNATLYQRGDPGQPRKSALDTAYPGVGKGDMIPAFVQAIRGEGRAEVAQHEALAAMQVCLAIDRSHREQATVRVDSISLGASSQLLQ